MELNYKKYGDSPNTVVVVHGLFGMLDNWHNISKKLSENFTVYAVDVRNHGGSPHSEEMSYDLIADDLRDFLQQHSLSSASFIGHSMGGKAVIKLADLHPEIIDKLCVVDIAPKRYEPGHLELFDAMFSLPIQTLTSRTEAEEEFAKKVTNSGVRLFLLKNIQRSEKGGFEWKLNLPAIRAHYEEIIDAVGVSWPFSNRTLWIKGAQSGYVSTEDETHILELFPNTEFRTISKAGHWVHAENPIEFYNTVHTFLTES